MNIWWCNQRTGWNYEFPAGVVRASEHGDSLTFRKTVSQARANDVVVHYRSPKVVAFSRAIEDGHSVDHLPDGYESGWQFRTEYFRLQKPIHRDEFRQRIEIPPISGFAFNQHGNVNQGYFFRFNLSGLGLILRTMDQAETPPVWIKNVLELDEGDDIVLEAMMIEGNRFSAHLKHERNRLFASEAKRIHGYICQVCSFDFGKFYGFHGEYYVEAHHLKPMAQYEENELVSLSPRADFCVVCANCHRMLHKPPFPEVAALRRMIQPHLSK